MTILNSCFHPNQTQSGHFNPSRFLTPVLTAAALLSPAALADLRQVPGLSGVQAATADAVQTICPQMVALNRQELLDPTQQLLLRDCGQLVHTSNAQQGTGTTALSLGLSEAELRDAIQRIAPEETEIMGAGSTDTAQDQLTNLQGRLQVLRTGDLGIPSSGITWSGGNQTGGAAGNGDFSRLGLFINGIYGTGEKDATQEEDGFEYDAYGLTAGLDYRFSDQWVAGIAVGLSNSEADLDNNFGAIDTDGYSLSAYGTFHSDNFYLEGSLTYGDYEYNGTRNIVYASNTAQPAVNQVVNSDTEGDQIAYSLGAGFNNYQGQWNYHLFARFSGIEADIDAYDESGSELAMRVASQSVESFQGVLGGQVYYAISSDAGVIRPYLGLEARFELEDDKRNITAQYLFDPTSTNFTFQTEAGDEDFYLLSAGASFQLKNGNQFYINYDTVLDLDDVDSDTLTFGIRMEL